MIQKGIIEQALSRYTYKVRVPRYDKIATDPSATSLEDLPSAVVCSFPGTDIAFNRGNVVIVDYENNEIDQPVILGLLYNESQALDEDNYNNFSNKVLEGNLSEYNTELQSLSKSGLYTHVKYSNDNGVTFTSKYSTVTVSTVTAGQVKYKVDSNISLDPSSTVIYWSIVDKNTGIDVTDNFQITTTIKNYINKDTNDSSQISQTFKESLIEIPLDFRDNEYLTLDYRIAEVSNWDNYAIVLTTDKDVQGSVYGEYLGIAVTKSAIPPDSPSEYAWTSFKTSIDKLVDTLLDEWLPRIRGVENTLYGYDLDDTSNPSGLGLVDVISVTKSQVDVHGTDNRDVSFNNIKSVYINNSGDPSVVTPEVDYKYNSSSNSFSEYQDSRGHLILMIKESN